MDAKPTEVDIVRQQRNALMARLLDLEVQLALQTAELAVLKETQEQSHRPQLVS